MTRNKSVNQRSSSDVDVIGDWERFYSIPNTPCKGAFNDSAAISRKVIRCGTGLVGAKVILIVAAGGGMELITFGQARSHWLLTGVDPSAKMLAIAQEKVALHGYTSDIHTILISHLGY
ncbi:class I SAM-dependent methyltransferase [aff. Roholtiella sp. LEGE 12411]|uniref:class I SAM-dependent methyltransferase n=1 Tax=aff. Roholtiella sp. LEGE 12411 TaxID=1828822 RepID=UPI001FC80EA3|nr:class I SAM-dependent methyltransferase [aff. Roholtiella sp. LEGE 12411]